MLCRVWAVCTICGYHTRGLVRKGHHSEEEEEEEVTGPPEEMLGAPTRELGENGGERRPCQGLLCERVVRHEGCEAHELCGTLLGGR